MINRSSEAYLDGLLTGKGVTVKKVSPRQYIIDHQNDLPIYFILNALADTDEKVVINDGKITGFAK